MEPGVAPPRHADAAPGSTPPGLTIAEEEEQRPSSDSIDHEDGPRPIDKPAPSGPVQTTTKPGEVEQVEEPRPSSASSAHHEASDSDTPPPTSSPPPFWSTSPSTRPLSYHSITQHRSGPPIQLEDHSEEDHVQAQSCWAESATIDEFVVVSGPTGIGAYVVWHCTVKTLKGGGLEIRKRYSEFDTLRTNLVASFPHAEAMIPELPRKSVVSRFRPRFLEARKRGLSHFLNCVLLNPEFASSPVLKEFVFS